MITTGSKLLIGSSLAAAVFAVVYGITQEGTLGVIGLAAAAVALAFMGFINIYTSDSNVSAMDTEAHATSAAASRAPGRSVWPFTVAFGATMLTLGLVTTSAVFIIGLVAILAAGAEWMVQAWSERASGDPQYNSEARGRLAGPLELPVLGAVGIAIVVFAVSRVMLGLPTKTATVVAFGVAGALVLAAGVLIGNSLGVSKGTLGAALGVGALAVLAGGTVAGVNGEREVHVHETLADLAETGQCGVDELEPDENASQTVASKSSVAAEIILDGEQLTYDLTGFNGGSVFTLPRANPNNVIFRNESDEERRLFIALDPTLEDGPTALCTALVGPGGSQFLTVWFASPSFAVEGGYQFEVPGVDGAELEVVVP